MHGGNFHLHRRRCDGLEMAGEQFRDFFRVLIGNEAHGDFGRGLAGDHGFCSVAGVSSPDAVDIQRGADAHAFRGGITFFALDGTDVDAALVFGFIERGFGHRRSLSSCQFHDIVIEPFD